jgi:7-cyano-7-deazaguanine synthase
MKPVPSSLAVLVSGGLDSAIFLAEALEQGAVVHPLYIRQGLYWEACELLWLRRFLTALARPALAPLQVLHLPVADLYGAHWSITGRGVPDAHSPDQAVFLPGRNILLLAKALLWCHLHQVPVLALACLQANPFPDATPAFFRAFQDCANQGIGGQVTLWTPYAGLNKSQVLRRGQHLPLALTFSCLQPVGEQHCGNCNKCHERQQAFAAVGLADPTPYAHAPRPGA